MKPFRVLGVSQKPIDSLEQKIEQVSLATILEPLHLPKTSRSRQVFPRRFLGLRPLPQHGIVRQAGNLPPLRSIGAGHL